MSRSEITHIQNIFASRLENLKHFLTVAEQHFGDNPDQIFALRLAPDMYPFGTQIAFTCNQPHHFALWCAGQDITSLDKDVTSLAQARALIERTQEQLAQIEADDVKLAEIKHVQLGSEYYMDLPGREYVDQHLMPNFYFHLTTAYALLRQAGVPLGKADYMRHLGPHVRPVQPATVNC